MFLLYLFTIGDILEYINYLDHVHPDYTAQHINRLDDREECRTHTYHHRVQEPNLEHPWTDLQWDAFTWR